MIERLFKLYLNSGNTSPLFINVSQYDHEVWRFELYTETGERYVPSSGAIIGIKSDSHGIAKEGTVDSEGRVVISDTEQINAATGRAIYELSIDDNTHGTANFVVNVERKPLNDETMSDSDLSLIQQALDEMRADMELVQQALDAINSTFKVTFLVNASTPSHTTTCDKTYAEISEALNARKDIDAHIVYVGREDPRVNADTVYEKVVLIERNANNIMFYGASMTSNSGTKLTHIQMQSNGRIMFMLWEF